MRRLTTEEFVAKASEAHGNRYDYSLVDYRTSAIKVKIVCTDHGIFEQKASHHMSGIGCPSCGGNCTSTTKEFIARARAVHGERYDYSLVDYKNNQTKVKIICPEHGIFGRTPSGHLQGYGCIHCRGTMRFIKRARAVHGDRYGYRHVYYRNSWTEVQIACPDHGIFKQKPDNHLRGHGCAFCGHGIPTNEVFIEKSRAKHGDRYDYSLVEYKTTVTEVKIICPEHGVFEQKPMKHLSGHGCQICSVGVVFTTGKFIAKAREVHGSRYDYLLVDYKNNRQNVKINCQEHGEFWQTPSSHIQGGGCPTCSGKVVEANERFIAKAREVHGSRYDYSLVDYRNNLTKVKIICPEHGVFDQRPLNHNQARNGCPKCAGTILKSTEEFIAQSREVHGDRYDYSLVNYRGNKLKVKIICPEHGEFEQQAKSHILMGHRCPKCVGGVAISAEEFVIRSRETHGNRFDYSLVKYKNSTTKVQIICPDHGVFVQAPNSHVSGVGCPGCAGSGFDQIVPAILYYIRIDQPGGSLYKIGITNRTVEERHSNDLDKITVVKTWDFPFGIDAMAREREVVHQFSYVQYEGPPVLVGIGNTEIFEFDVLGLDKTNPE